MLTDEERKALLDSFWREAVSQSEDYRNRREKSLRYYKNDQWSDEDKEKMDREKRPYLTFNFIKSIVRNIVGFQKQNRQEIKILARKGASSVVARVLTELIKYFEDISNAIWVKGFSFVDGIIGGKGWISIDIDYTDDPLNGDLVIKDIDPGSVFEDPNCKSYDLNQDGQFVWVTDWKVKSEVISEFDIDSAQADVIFSGLELDADKQSIISQQDTSDMDVINQDDEEGRTPETFRYLIKTCWWKHWEERRFLINRTTLDIKEMTTKWWKTHGAEAKRLVDEDDNFVIIKRVVPVLNYTVRLGSAELDHIEDPLDGSIKFPLVRFCPDFIKGHAMGEVESLIDAQNEANKRYSQTLHHLNQSANSGWIGDADALGSEGTSSWEDLKTFGSKAGVIIKVKRGRDLKRISPAEMSQGHFALATAGPEIMKRISGVNTDSLGQLPTQQESGKAIIERKAGSQQTTEIIHDNWRFTEKIVGETMLDYIRHTDVISVEEMLNIVQEENLNLTDAQGQPIPPEKIHQDLQNRAKGKYGTVVALSSSTLTARTDAFESMMRMLKEGLPLDPAMIIKNHPTMPEADKKEAIERIRQSQQLQPQEQ